MSEPSRVVLSNLSSLPYVFDDGFALTVPEFLHAAFTLLEERFLNREGIFRKAGISSKVKPYRVLFCSVNNKQSGYSLENLNAFDLCDLIKLFFRELEEPLLTFGLQGQFVRFVDANTPSNVKVKCLLQLCHALPPRHKETLAFLMRKLNKVAEHRAQNKMDIVNLATIFAPVIFRDNANAYQPKSGQALTDVMSASKLDVALKTEVIRLLTKACRSIGVLSTSERVMVSAGAIGQPYCGSESCFKVPLPVRPLGKPNRARKADLHHHITMLQGPIGYEKTGCSIKTDAISSGPYAQAPPDSIHSHTSAQQPALPEGDRLQLIDELCKAGDNSSLLPRPSTITSKISAMKRKPVSKENVILDLLLSVVSTRESRNVPVYKPPLVRETIENKFLEAGSSADRRNVLRKCSLHRSNSDPINGSPKLALSTGSAALGSRRLRRGRPNSLKAGLSGVKPSRVQPLGGEQFTDSTIIAPQTSCQILTEKSPPKIHLSVSKTSPNLKLNVDFAASDARKASLLNMEKDRCINAGIDDEDSVCIRPSIAFIREHRKGMRKHGTLRLLVSKGRLKILIGLDWFRTLGLNISRANLVTESSALEDSFEEFRDIFSQPLESYTSPEVALPLGPNVPSKHFKARNAPVAIRPRIEDEIDRLLKEGVIEPISNLKWSTLIVPVINSNGAIRLCGDYKSNLAGGQVFAKIDMAQAYLQLIVGNSSAEAQMSITHHGAFKIKRLQFGVSIALRIFQQVMDEALNSVPGVTPYFDEISIRAAPSQQLACRPKQVLQMFRKLGFRAKKEKCLFEIKTVDFLG
ncbi:Reverse transcriptase family protein [Trichuris trichiura]|uniref:Reverse transcriptase family protein n=1 Tax=Trichuris trichiura TaxID=36087 RepID=A0A077ZNL6_TRITR|nr:Reverse transcriptase family protein [Trichuris trichiura]